MGLEIFAFSLAVISALLVVAVFAVRKELRKQAESDVCVSWREYAERHAMRFDRPIGEWPRRSAPEVHGDDGAPGFLLRAVQKGERLRTHASLKVDEPILARLIASSDAAELSAPSPPTHDECGFSGTFAVEATPEVFALRILTPSVRRGLVAFQLGGYARLDYERGRVSLEWSGAEINHARIDEARRLLEAAVRAIRDAYHRGDGHDDARPLTATRA